LGGEQVLWVFLSEKAVYELLRDKTQHRKHDSQRPT
jgi:hypothetical protein